VTITNVCSIVYTGMYMFTKRVRVEV